MAAATGKSARAAPADSAIGESGVTPCGSERRKGDDRVKQDHPSDGMSLFCANQAENSTSAPQGQRQHSDELGWIAN